ncbi:MAG: TrmH family RNA methyltransferase [Bacteroidales bacterium]|nr:TrmH family RNA methyltransferase [Bacteroidales bacterium]
MENSYSNAVEFFKEKKTGENRGVESLILAAFELRTPENVGAFIRLAGNLGIDKVIFIAEENALSTAKIARVAHSSYKHVNFSFVQPSEFFSSIESDYQVVAVETCENASNLFKTKLPEKCVLLLGNERYGIDQEFLNRANQSVFIPLLGNTKSMNVSHAATLAAFEWSRQHWGLEQMI